MADEREDIDRLLDQTSFMLLIDWDLRDVEAHSARPRRVRLSRALPSPGHDVLRNTEEGLVRNVLRFLNVEEQGIFKRFLTELLNLSPSGEEL